MDQPPRPRGGAGQDPHSHLDLYADTGQTSDPGLELVWFDIELETVEPYEIWKPDSLAWALTVNWERVNNLVRHNLADYPVDSFEAALRSAEAAGLSPADQQGLVSLYQEPIFATARQISGGGHRLTAMRQQGTRWALGTCHPDDIGEGPDASVHPLVAYLPT